jgi:hypothetical protein
VTIDYEFSLLRAGIVALALVLLAHKVFVARRGRPDALARVRTVALVALALVAYGSYYYFFRFTHVGGLDSADMLQYYVGAKYFPEIGYFGTYGGPRRAGSGRRRRDPAGAEPAHSAR